MSRILRFAFYLLPITFSIGLLAAAPAQAESPDELIRRANATLRDGDGDAAEKLYAEAEERTADPGLVAFNRAAVLFDRKQFAKAAALYKLVLDDRACPPDRAAKAWYNRGTALLLATHNPAGVLDAYRTAIADFENAIDAAGPDAFLKANAEQNLVIAKLRWDEERKKAGKPDASPNQDVPPEEDRQPKPSEFDNQPGDLDPNGNDRPGGATPQPAGTQPQPAPSGTKPQETTQTTAGNNPQLEVLKDTDEVQKLTPEQARAYLQKTAEWRKRQRRAMLETLYGPERPGLRDW